ncbi:MAG: hypothetical protein ACLQVI_13410 [Polyangiaceae bacterium]
MATPWLAAPASGIIKVVKDRAKEEAARGEVLVPFQAPREQLKPVTKWRSTWILSSIQALREIGHGHYERYERMLPAEHRDAILLTAAAQWLPMPVAYAHYATLDALGLTREEAREMGARSGKRAQGTTLRTALRLGIETGVTPWTALLLTQKFWERGAYGGGTAVYKTGPKDSIVESVGCELFALPYFRLAYAGVFQAVLQMFSARVYANEINPRSNTQLTLRFQWV